MTAVPPDRISSELPAAAFARPVIGILALALLLLPGAVAPVPAVEPATARVSEELYFPEAPLPPGSLAVKTEINRQGLTMLPELPRIGSGLMPYIPVPFTVTLRDNLLPAPRKSLRALEFVTRVHINSDNAPATGGEIKLLWGGGQHGMLLSTGLSVVTGLESNIYSVRVNGVYRGKPLYLSFGGEGGLRLDLPGNEPYYALSAAAGAALIPERLALLLEYRGNMRSRDVVETRLRAALSSIWLDGGLRYGHYAGETVFSYSAGAGVRF